MIVALKSLILGNNLVTFDKSLRKWFPLKDGEHEIKVRSYKYRRGSSIDSCGTSVSIGNVQEYGGSYLFSN